MKPLSEWHISGCLYQKNNSIAAQNTFLSGNHVLLWLPTAFWRRQGSQIRAPPLGALLRMLWRGGKGGGTLAQQVWEEGWKGAVQVWWVICSTFQAELVDPCMYSAQCVSRDMGMYWLVEIVSIGLIVTPFVPFYGLPLLKWVHSVWLCCGRGMLCLCLYLLISVFPVYFRNKHNFTHLKIKWRPVNDQPFEPPSRKLHSHSTRSPSVIKPSEKPELIQRSS